MTSLILPNWPANKGRWANAILLLVQRLRRCPNSKTWLLFADFPADNDMRCWTSVVLMLAHRLRRWPNIKTTLVQHLMSLGLYHYLASEPAIQSISQTAIWAPRQAARLLLTFGGVLGILMTQWAVVIAPRSCWVTTLSLITSSIPRITKLWTKIIAMLG